jgi:predicted component of type VI protein secretion system
MPLLLRIVSENAKLLGEEREKAFVACGGTIGRSLDNDWVLPDPHRYVSGRHALIDYQAGAYYLVDTSRNGVFVNESDTPVGRGHPQRLFDGDRIRLGDYDMLSQISEDDASAEDDGMRDSVVRAQLVPEDPSVELALMSEDKMVDGNALAQHLAMADGSSRLSMLSEVIQLPTAMGDERAVGLLLEAAGLKPSDLAGTQPAEVLRTAGKLLRLMVSGMTGLLQERGRAKESYRISQTIIKREQNNPLKFSPGDAEALRYLLGNASDSYLKPEEAVRSSFDDLQQHQNAMAAAMNTALQDFMERFDPSELQSRFDRGMKRNALLAGANKLKYWELYEECYHVLTHREDGKLPEAFAEEFARAYEDEIKQAKATRRAS